MCASSASASAAFKAADAAPPARAQRTGYAACAAAVTQAQLMSASPEYDTSSARRMGGYVEPLAESAARVAWISGTMGLVNMNTNMPAAAA